MDADSRRGTDRRRIGSCSPLNRVAASVPAGSAIRVSSAKLDLIAAQRLDDDEAEAGQGDDDDEEDGGRDDDCRRPASSARAISASDLPPRRTEAASTSMSCTAPARQTPITSQSSPGM